MMSMLTVKVFKFTPNILHLFCYNYPNRIIEQSDLSVSESLNDADILSNSADSDWTVALGTV